MFVYEAKLLPHPVHSGKFDTATKLCCTTSLLLLIKAGASSVVNAERVGLGWVSENSIRSTRLYTVELLHDFVAKCRNYSNWIAFGEMNTMIRNAKAGIRPFMKVGPVQLGNNVLYCSDARFRMGVFLGIPRSSSPCEIEFPKSPIYKSGRETF